MSVANHLRRAGLQDAREAAADVTHRAVLYIQGYDEVPELRRGLARYFAFFNHWRLHQALGYRTPAAVYAMLVTCESQAIPASERGIF
jgi:transposase InsO family protein